MRPPELPEGARELIGAPEFDNRADTVTLYFLAHQGVVVYVGVTWNDVRGRASWHRNGKSRKVFDSLFYVDILWEDAEVLEKEWIAKLKPIHNIAGKTKAYSGYNPLPGPDSPLRHFWAELQKRRNSDNKC